MKQLAKRGLAMLTAFVLVISLMPAMHHHTAHAAGNEVEYVYSSDGKYIYNWGTRGDTATFLSPKAEEFYTGNYIYDVLSATPGGTSASTAPNSALYDALQDLMSSKQTYQTSYDATRDLYRYTDCEGSAKVSDKISCFYSGAPIGPAWDGGNTWNREHTWPNSKGDASGNGENDIMMLRPASMVANSSRGNKAYGESSSYYYPNVESNDKYDVRGDVARIMLYVYVRWGNTERMWGSDGVIESLDVLLNWMEADPVDTWELGRNDSVQAITGTRNVFVDYPEFAFLLFGAEIPENMTTPSGEAGNTVTCQHNYVAGEVVAATCTAEGYTVYTCSLCERSYRGDMTPVIAHSYADGKCTVCGKDEPLYVVDAPVAGTAYKFGMIQQNVSAADVYYLTGAMDGYYMATTTDDTNAIDVYLENTTGGYYLYTAINGIKTYINMVVNGTYVNGAYEATASTVYIFDETSKTVVAQVNGATYWFGTRNDKTYTTVGPCDVSYNGFYCQFYSETVDDSAPTCEHTNTTIEGAVAATCTTDGYTGKTVCSDCGKTIGFGQAIPALGHNYENGTCTRCGEAEPAGGAATTVTVSIKDYAAANGWSNSIQYKELKMDDAVTVTVSGTQNTGKYYTSGYEWRIYQTESPSIIISAGDKTILSVKITYNINNSGVLTLNGSNISSGTVVDVNASSVTFGVGNTGTKTNGQVKITAIEVVYAGGANQPEEPACEHTSTKVEGAVEAACTTKGHTGKTICVDCNAVLSEGEEIPALGHNYVNGTCTRCGVAEPAPGAEVTVTVSIKDYAAANGWSNSVQYKELKMDDNVTVTVSGTQNTGKYYTSGYEWRIYQTESPSIVVSAGDKNIVSVKITYTAKNSGVLTLNGSKITSGTVVDVNASSVTFGVGNTGTATNGQVKITAIEVVYVGGGTTEPEEPVCQHTNTKVEGAAEASCTAKGHTGKTICVDCNAVLSEGEEIPALGHNYVDGVCTRCGEAEPDPNAPVTVKVSIKDYAAANGWSNSIQYKELKMDDVVTVTVSGTQNTGKYYTSGYEWRIYQTESPSIVVSAGDKTILSVKITYNISNSGVLTLNGSNIASGTVVDVNASSVTFGVGNTGTKTNGQVKITAIEVVYSNGGQGGEPEPDPVCQHTNTTVEGAVEATCTTAGHTGKTVCADCGETVSEGSVIPALGHNYVDGICTRCGVAEPITYEISIDLTTKDNRTVYSAEQQVWKQTGITVTNDKAASTNDVGDYAPARFYKSSKLTVSYPGMMKIVFNCNDYKDTYASDLAASIGTIDGVTVTVDGLVVTVQFAAAQDSFVIEKLAGQVRVNSITVISTTEPCQHTNTTVDGAIDATCTTEGHTGKTICADCGDTVSKGDVVPALGHNFVDGVCTRCGEAEPAPSCQHTNTTTEGATDATCTTEGHTGKTVCTDCGETVSEGSVIPALGHNYENGTCTRCGEHGYAFGVIESPVAGTGYKFGMIQENVSNTNVYYLTGAMDGYYMATTTDKAAAIDVYLEETTGGYYLYAMINGVKTYINMVVSGTHVNGAYEAAASTVYTFDETSMTLVAEVNGSNYWFGTRNDKTYTTVGPCDVSYNGFHCQFYGDIIEDVTPPTCEHTSTTTVGTIDATCTTEGHTGKTICADCGDTVSEGSVIPALGHNYVDGVCTRCGEAEPSTPETNEVTIDLTTKENRTVYTEDQQVWEQNGITVTNDKAASTTNVGDYAPARFYKSSKLTVAYPGMTKIVFNCNNYKDTYAADLATSIGTAEGVTVTVDGSVVTVVFATAQDSFVIEKLVAQVRVDSITVSVAADETPETPCQHTNTTTVGATDATCTTEGHTGKTVCADCGEMVSEGSVIPALGHNFVDGICTRCGEADGTVKPEPTPDPEPEEPKVYIVSFSLNGHGKPMASQRVTEGTRAAKPADPTAEGYIFEGWYLDAACTIPYNFSSVVTESFMLYAKWTEIESEPEVNVDSAEVFEDLTEEAWYFDAVDFMVDNGLMNGVSETEFAPEEKLSRAMMWTILARLSGEDTDGGANWYDKGREWAMHAGISDGSDANAEITREQLVVMLWRFMGEPAATGSLSVYTDADSVSDWAKEAMAWAIETGLVNGTTPTTLDPKSNATRAQVATLVQRFYAMMEAKN